MWVCLREERGEQRGSQEEAIGGRGWVGWALKTKREEYWRWRDSGLLLAGGLLKENNVGLTFHSSYW